MTTSAKQMAAYRPLNHVRLMQASESPLILLSEDSFSQNEPISAQCRVEPGRCPHLPLDQQRSSTDVCEPAPLPVHFPVVLCEHFQHGHHRPAH